MITMRDAGYRDELARLTPNMRRFARALVQDHSAESADDLVQATLVQALGAVQDRRGHQLAAALLSMLVDLHRAQVRDVSADKVSAQGGASQNGAGRSTQWEMPHQRRRHDIASLGSMPLECREVFLLVTLEGLTYVQVAEALNLSLSAVVGRLSRAREHLGHEHATTASAKPAPEPRRRDAVTYLRVVK